MAGALLPLEQRTILAPETINGHQRSVPAIHPLWCSSGRSWHPLPPLPPPEAEQVAGALDVWLSCARLTAQDLSWLLRLPAHKFWSQLCHDQHLQSWFDSLLDCLPRPHEGVSLAPPVERLSRELLRLTFLTALRLSTYKESATDFFSPDHYATIIYDNYLMEVPRLLDLCCLFYPSNPSLVSKMVANIFKVAPAYHGDLITSGETMLQAFDSLGEQLQALSMHSMAQDSVSSLGDLVAYLLDLSVSLASLAQAFPQAAVNLHHHTQLTSRVAVLYTQVNIPLNTMALKNHNKGYMDESSFIKIKNKLCLSRHSLITYFRTTVDQVCLKPILDKDANHSDGVEEFLAIFSSILSEQTFLRDYDKKFSIRDDLEMFLQAGLEVDQTRKHYILDAFAETSSKPFTDLGARPKTSKASSVSKPTEPSQTVRNVTVKAKAGPPKGVELDSLVASVRDLLPHLGEGFVQKCLENYNYQVDELVNALLEGNLPPHLAELDQSMPKDVEAEVEPEPEPTPRSVYEHDEFDINTRDEIDKSKIHKGKKNKFKNADKFLNDKSDLLNWNVTDRFAKLGIVSDDIVGEDAGDDYNDEYDDTYDDNATGQQEPDAGEETGRQFVLPVALGGGKIKPVSNNVEDDEEDEDEDNAKARMDFVRNPEEVRAENERKRQERLRRNNNKGGGSGGGGPPSRDVVGKAKGQGQEKQVLINRARKNTNKGKGHRIAADKKASKGMF